MFDYAAIQGTASSLIANYGATATFSATAGATFNPATGTYTGGSATTVTGKAVRMNYEKSEIDGQIVQRGDFKLMFGATAGAPAIGDTVAFDGNSYRVMGVNVLSPADVVVMYDVHCRR